MKVALFEKKNTQIILKPVLYPVLAPKSAILTHTKIRKASTLISTQKKYYHEQEQEHLRKTGN